MALKLIVVTPERKVLDTDADEVQLPGELGYLGILPGHTPLITVLRTGVLSYRSGGRDAAFALSSGFAEISNDVITVLADLAETPGEIDATGADQDRARAEEELKTANADTMEEIRARLELAQARLAVVRRGGATA